MSWKAMMKILKIDSDAGTAEKEGNLINLRKDSCKADGKEVNKIIAQYKLHIFDRKIHGVLISITHI